MSTNRWIMSLGIVAALGLSGAMFAGCEEQPAEETREAGQSLRESAEEAGENMKEQAEEAGEAMKESAEDAKDAAEDAAKDLQNQMN